MSDNISLSSGTTALTNALKQVFYIHKDVVAELKVKLDSLKKENDELKQLKRSPENGSGPCLSCKHLKELNKTLQENFNSRLRDKNAIIKHLEERLKNLTGSIDTQIDTEVISTPTLKVSRKVKESDVDTISAQKSSPGKTKILVASCQKDSSTIVGQLSETFCQNDPSPNNGAKRWVTSSQRDLSPNSGEHSGTSHNDLVSDNNTGAVGRHSSKLRLPREGHKRSRYVEQEDHVPESKRVKTSPSSSHTPSQNQNPCHHPQAKENKSSNGVDHKEILLNMHASEISLVKLPLHHHVLAHETENFTCLDKGNNNNNNNNDNNDNKNNKSYLTTIMKNDLSDEGSPNMLVIPETMGLEDFSDKEEENSDFGDTLMDAKQNNMQAPFEREVLCDNDIQNCDLPSSSDKNSQNLSESSHKANKIQNQEQVRPLKWKPGDGMEKKEMTSGGTVSLSINSLVNISSTSPLSPGIFEELARPKSSSSETPRSSKMTEKEERIKLNKDTGSISSNVPKDIDLGHIIEFRSRSDHENSRRLLRQTTLSQSFSTNLKSGNKTKDRMGKESIHDEEAAIQEAVRQSLLESEKMKDLMVTSSSRHDDNDNTLKHGNCSPSFKMPLSPVGRKSPRTRGKSSHNCHNDKLRNEKPPRDKESILEKRDMSSPAADTSCSSPIRKGTNKVKVSRRQGSRSSPRFLSSQGHIATPPRGELAKKVLFLDNGSGTKSPMKQAGMPKSSKEISLGTETLTTLSPLASSQQHCDLMEDEMKETAAVQDLNASMDPDMRLSVYLDSEDSALIPLKGRHVNDQSMCSFSEALMDMDETVAPNLMSLGAMESSQITTSARNNMRGGSGGGSRRIPKRQDSSLAVDDYDKDENVCDDCSESKENVEETIAPSPQQQSTRLLSQSLPNTGIPSSSRSFKFVNRIHHKNASSHTDSQTIATQIQKEKAKNCNMSDKEENVELSDDFDDFKETSIVIGGCRGGSCIAKNISPQLHTSRPAASLYDSFDIVPPKPAEFAHVQVVRKKSERDKLQGFSCKQCFEYYKDMNLSEKELEQRMKNCSRHKDKYKPPSTPEHFWSLSIRDTAEEDAAEREEKLPDVVRLRRRRRLQKRFKAKGEEEDEEGGV